MLIGIRHASLPVLDLNRATDFYVQNFGFEIYQSGDADWAMLTLGGTSLSLMPFNPIDGRKIGHDSPASHLGIQAQSKNEVDALFEKLSLKETIQVQKPKLHRDASYGFYFKDTEGNALELIFIPHVPNPSTKKTLPGIVLFAHGSSDPRWKKSFEGLLSQLKDHYPYAVCELAYMEFTAPTLMQAVENLAAQGCRQILISPVFMAGGGHAAHDIPALVAEVETEYSEIEFKTGKPLGENPLVQEALINSAVTDALRAFKP